MQQFIVATEPTDRVEALAKFGAGLGREAHEVFLPDFSLYRTKGPVGAGAAVLGDLLGCDAALDEVAEGPQDRPLASALVV